MANANINCTHLLTTLLQGYERVCVCVCLCVGGVLGGHQEASWEWGCGFHHRQQMKSKGGELTQTLVHTHTYTLTHTNNPAQTPQPSPPLFFVFLFDTHVQYTHTLVRRQPHTYTHSLCIEGRCNYEEEDKSFTDRGSIRVGSLFHLELNI